MVTRPVSDAVGVAEIELAASRIADRIRQTPLLPSIELSRRLGAEVMLKAECLQRTGSFKIRGASWKMAGLERDALERGVVAASAGNHAQAVALAASAAGVRADLFMPAEAPLAKFAAVRSHDGVAHAVEGSYDDAALAAAAFAEREARTIIHPFDDAVIVAGQGTLGLELAEQQPRIRLVLVPLGGGALAAGVAIAMKARIPGVRVIGVQSEACAPHLGPAGAAGEANSRPVSTICDGIAVKRPGELTRPLVEAHVDEIVSVSDDEAAEAMVLLLEHPRLVVEGAGGVGVAALLAGKVQPAVDGATCAILSGGNVDATRLVECIRMGETAAGRRMVLLTVLPDRPGALAALLGIVADCAANVMDVEHIREGVELHVRETAIQLVLQTDGPEHSERVLAAVREQGFDARAQL